MAAGATPPGPGGLDEISARFAIMSLSVICAKRQSCGHANRRSTPDCSTWDSTAVRIWTHALRVSAAGVTNIRL